MPDKNNDFVIELKSNINIVNVISDYVSLKKAGKNYKGLCPFHREKTPSFTVNPEKQFYYCFGCGNGGDIINFIMELENVTFRQALKILAERAGMTLPANDNPQQQRIRAERERIFEINKLTAKFYHYILIKKKIGVDAVTYLEKRGFNKEDFQKYCLGYAPEGWRVLFKFLTRRGYKKELLLKAGLILQGKNNSYYDRFRGRVIFPIFNIRGEVVAFGGRLIKKEESSPKYLNSPDTTVYKKSKNLYGLNWAREEMRKSGEAVIMEGYTDVLTAHKKEIKNAIASLGTAFTVEQARLLKRYTDNIYIAYDADGAGAKATLRGLDILNNEGLNVRVIKLPEGTDPDVFLNSNGRSDFIDRKEEAVNLIEFKVGQVADNYNLKKVDERISFIRELIRILSKISNQMERDIYLDNIVKKYNLNYKTVKDGLNRYLRDKDRNKKDKNYKNRYTKKDNETKPEMNINILKKNILKFYIDLPDKRNELKKYLKPDYFPEDYRRLVELLRKKTDFEIDSFVNSLGNKKIKNQILSLVVGEDDLQENYQTVLNNYIKLIKEDIYNKLQNYENIELNRINKMLIEFVRISI